MSTMLAYARDVQGYNAYAPPPSTDIYSATLTTGVATSITVPKNYAVWVAAFSFEPGADVWVDFTGATAAIPAGGTLASTTATLNPGQRQVAGGSTISMITDTLTADACIELYAVSYP
jgi:hypothetical protein